MTQTPVKSVVLCADDYALNTSVSQGIVALALLGRLSATSVMVHSPTWAQDAVALRDVRHRLDVGLHLDWTSHFAQQAGFGAGLGRVMLRACMSGLGWGGFDAQAVRDEIERQLDAFETHWQAPPDHVDGHQHIQQFAGLREPLFEVLTRRYGARAQRPWLRVSQVAQPGIKGQIISRMGAHHLQHWAQQHDWPVVAPLLGVYGFDGSLADYAQHMQGWLRDVPCVAQPALIMCHPALSPQIDDEIGPARAREFAYLASDDFVQHLRDAGVRVVRASETFT
jgi:predicted glycoside hydrolase/deacetylase ChbG (UPF0249 family)